MLLSANSGMHGPHPNSVRYTLLEAVDFFADAGFDAIDMNFCPVIYSDSENHEPVLDSENWEQDLAPVKEKCRQRGLKTGITHLPYRFDYAQMEYPDFSYHHAMTCRALQASEYIDADWAVLHMHENPEATLAYVRKLFAESGVKRTGIALENMFQYPIEDLVATHDRLKEEGYRVGICLDTGHAHVNKFHAYNLVELIRLMGDRIKVLHVHDNHRSADRHMEPYRGSIPWRRVMEALKEAGFTGELNFETITSQLPDDIRSAYAKYTAAIGRRLIRIFEDYEPQKENGI